MRTLLIDNHDSFTWNLVHLLSTVTGEMPTVITNDDPHFQLSSLRHYDQIILSPGPGSPENAKDFGLCTQILQQSDLPILGVCLGHQGLCWQAGAQITQAPTPYHGLLSHITHHGDGLFADIPSPFTVVRYHSLMVAGDLSEFQILSRSDDDVVMAVKHRTKPQWGVQFHPESIATEYGVQILKNFLSLSAAYNKARFYTSEPFIQIQGSEKHRPKARQKPEIIVETITDWVDPEVCFEALYAQSAHSFWLDSSNDKGFSFMGDTAGPHAVVATGCVADGHVTLREQNHVQRIKTGFLEWLEQQTQTYQKISLNNPSSFTTGWVGYLGYGLKAECGAQASPDSELPDGMMMFADRILAFDHAMQKIYLMAYVEPPTAQAGALWCAQTKQKLHEIKNTPVAEPSFEPQHAELILRHNREAYLDLIESCQTYLQRGESYEICLTNQLTGPALAVPLQAYKALRRKNPVPFGAFIKSGDVSILSCSPESFLKISAAGEVESKPIKGTRPRHHDPELDQQLIQDLKSSQKDRAENLMIVDLVRNDLGRYAQAGSVSVEKLFDVETYSTVHQLVSTIKAQLKPEYSVVECVRAAFPGGSMTGAPKKRTMQILEGLENSPRGIYAGSIGYFSTSGAVDLNIVIRTCVATPDKTTYGIGGAITVLSDKFEEFEETAVKSAPFLSLFNASFPQRRG